MQTNDQLSKAFMAGGFICTLLVVAIHYNSLYHFENAELANPNFLIQSYLNLGLTRIAVPFFAFTSGFFFYSKFNTKLDTYITAINKRLFTLVIPYITVATIVFYFNNFINWRKGAYFNLDLHNYYSKLITPETIQLWYIRDLFFLSIISPIIFIAVKKFPKLFIGSLILLWIPDIQILPKLGEWELIKIETLCLFSIGCFASTRHERFEYFIKQCSVASSRNVLIVTFFLLMLERTISELFFNSFNQIIKIATINLPHKIAILIGIISLLANYYDTKRNNILTLAQFNFFIYLYHLLPLSKFILLFWNNFVEEKFLFFVTTPTAIFTTLLVGTFIRSASPRFYKFLTGGR